MVNNIKSNSKDYDGFVIPENPVGVKESDILRFIVEYENTKLKEDELLNQISELDESENIIDNATEQKALKRRLNDIQDRYRLNPFVTEVNGEFVMKYKQFGGKIELTKNNIEEDNIMKTMPKINFNIAEKREPRIKLKKIDESKDMKPMSKIKMFVEEEVSAKSDVKIEVGLKISPPNPQREFRNPDYNNGIYPEKLGILFKLITSITYKKYPVKQKGYWDLYREKKKHRETFDFSTSDIMPHCDVVNSVVNIRMEDQAERQSSSFKSFIKMVKPQFANIKTESKTNNNMERVMNYFSSVKTESMTSNNMQRFMRKC